jgi:hypothetical protein
LRFLRNEEETLGTALCSSFAYTNQPSSYGPQNVQKDGFDFWGGRRDDTGNFWIGIESPEPISVNRVQLEQSEEHWVERLVIEAKCDSGRWVPFRSVQNLAPGANDVLLFDVLSDCRLSEEGRSNCSFPVQGVGESQWCRPTVLVRSTEPSVSQRRTQRSEDEPGFYHDLQCLSGFGDRLLDLWAAATVARLHDPDKDLAIRWDEGLSFLGFVGTYSTDLFSVERCQFVLNAPPGAQNLPKHFDASSLQENCILPLPSGLSQIILRDGMNWGNTYPDRLHRDLVLYGLDSRIDLETITQVFRAVARSTKPDPKVVEGIPSDIGRRVGVHIRVSDKLVADETAIDMNVSTWESIQQRALDYIDRCVVREEPLFICSEDSQRRNDLVEHIKRNGGDVVVAQPPEAHCHISGYGALVDFFSLTRCSRIVQMTKYSTYSLAASVVGDIQLVNFYRDSTSKMHRLDEWKFLVRR